MGVAGLPLEHNTPPNNNGTKIQHLTSNSENPVVLRKHKSKICQIVKTKVVQRVWQFHIVICTLLAVLEANQQGASSTSVYQKNTQCLGIKVRGVYSAYNYIVPKDFYFEPLM